MIKKTFKTQFNCQICPNNEYDLCKKIGVEIEDYVPDWCPLWDEDVKKELI